jgi:hypothetical protein
MCPADPQDGGSGHGSRPPDYQGPQISGLGGGELDSEQLSQLGDRAGGRPSSGSVPPVWMPAAWTTADDRQDAIAGTMPA